MGGDYGDNYGDNFKEYADAEGFNIPELNRSNLKPRPNSVLYVLLFNTEVARCKECNNVVLYAREQRAGNEFYCFCCHSIIGYDDIYTGEEQTPAEFDLMLDSVTLKLGLDNT